MIQNSQNKQQTHSASKQANFLDSINSFVNEYIINAPKKDKIAYGLIALGIIFVIVGIILW
jgi:hypothetical protein